MGSKWLRRLELEPQAEDFEVALCVYGHNLTLVKGDPVSGCVLFECVNSILDHAVVLALVYVLLVLMPPRLRMGQCGL